MPPNLYAWTPNLTSGQANQHAHDFPNLGLVLYHTNLDAAERVKVPPIAYVTSTTTATRVADMARAGVPFRAALILDERNHNGPSGTHLTPEAYARAYQPIHDILAPHVTVSTMGLMAIGGWWRQAFRARVFDRAYHDQLPPANARAWNPNQTRLTHVRRVLDTTPGPWILSPAPFRGWWDRTWEPISIPQWAALSARPDVLAVAFWCLREVYAGAYFGNRWQSEHGLLDRHGRVTNVGKLVQAALA